MILYEIFLKRFWELTMDEKIDFIVTYLDSEDTDWIKAKAENDGSDVVEALNSTARYRNLDNFQYWFRAVERYAPWVNKIHLVTWGHIPEWLNTAHPKLNIIKHEDYIPEKYLPTFNSNVIELNYDRIDNLAEQFVNFNDDMFLNADTKPSDFFVNGLPKLQMMYMPIQAVEKFSTVLFNNMLVLNSLEDSTKIFNKGMYSLKNGLFATATNLYLTPLLKYFNKFMGFYPDHLPNALLKSSMSELKESAPSFFDETSNNKFRTINDINIWLCQDYLRATGKFSPRNSFKFGQVLEIKDDQNYSSLLSSKYKVVCVNDGSEGVKDFDLEKDRILETLEKKFPVKSEFEK